MSEPRESAREHIANALQILTVQQHPLPKTVDDVPDALEVVIRTMEGVEHRLRSALAVLDAQADDAKRFQWLFANAHNYGISTVRDSQPVPAYMRGHIEFRAEEAATQEWGVGNGLRGFIDAAMRAAEVAGGALEVPMSPNVE